MEDITLKLFKQNGVRVRFAPSPTGPLHIGVARTALFNYLFAKKNKGTFILRIDDTDKERSKPEYEKDIKEGLEWLGLRWDEEYKESERLEIYKKYLKKLLDQGKAYYCFCPEEELEAQRQYQMSIGRAPCYDGKCSKLSAKQIEDNLKEKKDFVIRFKVSGKKIKFKDLIRGDIEFDTSLIGDFVIAKDFSTPLYNFTGTIDDYEMKITHVIRGEDHISNTPKQILIQKSLKFPKPEYAHISLILSLDRAKLSKRHGALSLSEYKEQGYLPETLINFLAFLGWNPGDEREIFSLRTLIKEFSLERCQKSGAVFNAQRLDWINGFYIRHKSLDKLTELCIPYLIKEKLIKLEKEDIQEYKVMDAKEKINFDYLKKIIQIYQERLKRLSEVAELTDFFFKKKLKYNKELLKWKDMTEKQISTSLDISLNILDKIKEGNWNKEFLEKILFVEAEKFGSPAVAAQGGAKEEAGLPAEAQRAKAGDRGKLLWPLRVALTNKKASASPFEIAEILGKEKTLDRIKQAMEVI